MPVKAMPMAPSVPNIPAAHGNVAAVEYVQEDDEQEPPKQGRKAAADAGRQQLGAQIALCAGAQHGGHGKAAV